MISFNGTLYIPSLKQGFEENTVSVLRKAARKSSILISGIAASEVSLAVPKRIPRELRRDDLLRLEGLGAGNFASVDKYQVQEVSRRTPAYFAAVKSEHICCLFHADG